jgi:hypothetical protein
MKKPYRGRDGKPQLWFKPGEIDDWMEAELREAGLYPKPDRPAVDVESFVDRHLQVALEQYADLEPHVLGQTRFEAGRRPRVLINRNLTELAIDAENPPAWLRSKWRMTMAHEASHVLLHKCLYAADPNQQTFGWDDEPEGVGLTYHCLERNLTCGRGVDPREVQANNGMAALLLPRTFFLAACETGRTALGIDPNALTEDSFESHRLARKLADLCDVSVQSVSIRLAELGVLTQRGEVRFL